MNVKSTFILTSGLLFLSVPAWGDSMKSRQTTDSDTSSIVNTSNDWSGVGQSDGRDRGGFDIEGYEHRKHRRFDEDRDRHRDRDRDRDHFDSDDFPPTSNGPAPSGPTPGGPSSNPVGTPEPGSLVLLFSGLFCVGSLFYTRFYRRNQSLLSCNHPTS
jgi:hypothetical protein